MRVRARYVEPSQFPPALAKELPPGQVFLTAGAEYEVFALAVFEGRLSLQVVEAVDGHDFIFWRQAWLFDVVDSSLPADWICNFFREEPSLILGPPFVARDIDSYASMVQLESDAVNQFWARVGPRSPGAASD